MEEWKDIKDTGWKVSSLGNMMKPDGRCINFRSNDYRKCELGWVHRIVAYYFCNPPCEANKSWVCEGYAVHHVNRNPADNRAENLKYLTHEEHRKVHKEMSPKHKKDKDTKISNELISLFLNSLRV